MFGRIRRSSSSVENRNVEKARRAPRCSSAQLPIKGGDDLPPVTDGRPPRPERWRLLARKVLGNVSEEDKAARGID